MDSGIYFSFPTYNIITQATHQHLILHIHVLTTPTVGVNDNDDHNTQRIRVVLSCIAVVAAGGLCQRIPNDRQSDNRRATRVSGLQTQVAVHAIFTGDQDGRINSAATN